MMKDYTNYSSAQFIENEDFIKWVKNPGRFPEIDSFWNQWVIDHPERKAEITEARNIILAIVDEGDIISLSQREEDVWQRLNYSIEREDLPVLHATLGRYRIAASFLLIALVGFGVL